jgi:hypothetical protein
MVTPRAGLGGGGGFDGGGGCGGGGAGGGGGGQHGAAMHPLAGRGVFSRPALFLHTMEAVWLHTHTLRLEAPSIAELQALEQLDLQPLSPLQLRFAVTVDGRVSAGAPPSAFSPPRRQALEGLLLTVAHYQVRESSARESSAR